MKYKYMYFYLLNIKLFIYINIYVLKKILNYDLKGRKDKNKD